MDQNEHKVRSDTPRQANVTKDSSPRCQRVSSVGFQIRVSFLDICLAVLSLLEYLYVLLVP